MANFDKASLLSYLGLPQDYEPSPDVDPISFLSQHITQLPPQLLLPFTHNTSPKQRTVLPIIRNRRLKYASNNPATFQFSNAKSRWPNLWQGCELWGAQEGEEEKTWAETDFLLGSTKYVGKLGNLLAGYEEEREAERARALRRELALAEVPVAEEDSSSDEGGSTAEIESLDEAKTWFERSIRERFIYGLLEPFGYEEVDWDETLDEDDDRDAEERWFDEDDDDE